MTASLRRVVAVAGGVAIALLLQVGMARPTLAAWTTRTTNGGAAFAAGTLSADTALTVTSTKTGAVTATWSVPPAAALGLSQDVLVSIKGGARTVYTTLPPAATSAGMQGSRGEHLCIEVSQVAGSWAATTAPVCIVVR